MFILIKVGKFLKLEMQFLWFDDVTLNMTNAVTIIQLGLWVIALVTQLYFM